MHLHMHVPVCPSTTVIEHFLGPVKLAHILQVSDVTLAFAFWGSETACGSISSYLLVFPSFDVPTYRTYIAPFVQEFVFGREMYGVSKGPGKCLYAQDGLSPDIGKT